VRAPRAALRRDSWRACPPRATAKLSMLKLQIFERRPWLRDVLIVAVVLVAIRAYQQRDLPSGAAPQLEGKLVDGSVVSLASYRGEPVLVHFWATWCGVCRMEQGSIDAIASDRPVLSISSRSGEADLVSKYVTQHQVKPRVVVDSAGALAQRFGVHAFPTTFVLDRNGDIRFREVGYTTELGLRARLWLVGLLPSR
jgi:thiol-disulfide isomerase/thioredoxin